MTGFDFSVFQNTDVRDLVRPEVRAALRMSDSADRFQVRAMLSGAFNNPSKFVKDGTAQQAFIDLVGVDEARRMMKRFRLVGVEGDVSYGRFGNDEWHSLHNIMSFSKEQAEARADGSWRVMGSAQRLDLDVNTDALPHIIRDIRSAVLRRREFRRPRNIFESLRVDFVGGHVGVVGTVDDDLKFNTSLLSSVEPPYDEEELDHRAMLAPDIGLRMLGERQLAFIANRLLRMLRKKAKKGVRGKAPDMQGWTYRRSIDGLVKAFGDVDATPFIEGLIDEGQRHLIVATYHDYLHSHLDRRLQWLLKVEPDVSGEGTVKAVMRSLYLAMDSCVMPDELHSDKELAKIFMDSRAHLKGYMDDSSMSGSVKEVVKGYLKMHGDAGLVWFLGQILPLVAYYSDERSFSGHGLDFARLFDPDAHYGWQNYGDLAAHMRSAILPLDDGPGGGERMCASGEGIPQPALESARHSLFGPRIRNYARSNVRGGTLVAGMRAA